MLTWEERRAEVQDDAESANDAELWRIISRRRKDIESLEWQLHRAQAELEVYEAEQEDRRKAG